MPQISFSLLGRRMVHITTCTTKSVPRVYSTAVAGSTALVVIEEARRRRWSFRFPRLPGSGTGFLGVAGLWVSFYAASIQARAILVDEERPNHEMQAKVAEERAVREEERAKLAEERAIRAKQRAERAEKKERAEKEAAEKKASEGWFGWMGKK